MKAKQLSHLTIEDFLAVDNRIGAMMPAPTTKQPQFFYCGGYGLCKSDGTFLYYERGLRGSGIWVEATQEIQKYMTKQQSR